VLFENLSGRAAVDEVLTFYEGRTALGALARSPEPAVGRAVPGFGAENPEYFFGIDLYRHKDLTSWTIQLTDRTLPTPNRIPRLRLLKRDSENAILQNIETGEEYVAPASALTETDPQERIERYSRPRKVETIAWSALPAWASFGLEVGSPGEVHRQSGRNGRETWNATRLLRLNSRLNGGDHRDVFEQCLNSLDASGFDATGASRPGHSYYESVLQWGHSLNAQVRSDARDGGSLTVLNTLGDLSAFLRYSPPRAS